MHVLVYLCTLFISADRMRSDFGFGENDVNNIDRVIEALKELVCILQPLKENWVKALYDW